jgi:hypothetical protein
MEALTNAIESSASAVAKQLTMFWDKQCLPIGENWELGFLNCLRSCKVIILMVTPESVVRCKEAGTVTDNFLLEMDLATELQAAKKAIVIPIFMVEKGHPGGHEGFLQALTTDFPDTKALHSWSKKSIAATLRAVVKLPGAFKTFRGDPFFAIAENIASQCPPSTFFFMQLDLSFFFVANSLYPKLFSKP